MEGRRDWGGGCYVRFEGLPNPTLHTHTEVVAAVGHENMGGGGTFNN